MLQGGGEEHNFKKKIHSQEKYKKYNFLYKVDFLFSLYLR